MTLILTPAPACGSVRDTDVNIDTALGLCPSLGVGGAQPLGAVLRNQSRAISPFILAVDSTSSTNDLARRYAEQGAPHGSLFLAHAQTHGRGRFGRSWESGAGGLYISMLLRHGLDGYQKQLPLLPLAVSVAAVEAIEDVTKCPVTIRWPNDLYAGDQKLGGILCETSFSGDRLDLAVVGCGVNVNQARFGSDEVRARATSLFVLTQKRWDRLALAAALVDRLSFWCGACKDPSAMLNRWRELAVGDHGQKIRVVRQNGDSFEAVSAGVEEDGGLSVRLPDGSRQVLYAEDVRFARGV